MAATDDHSLRTAVAALGGAGEAVVVADAERLHIVAANDTALALLGSDPLGHHIAWLLPDLVAEDLQHRITALLSIGERSIVFTARPRWEAEGGADVPVRVDVVERDGSPFVVAFIRDSPEDRASRPPREPASPLAPGDFPIEMAGQGLFIGVCLGSGSLEEVDSTDPSPGSAAYSSSFTSRWRGSFNKPTTGGGEHSLTSADLIGAARVLVGAWGVSIANYDTGLGAFETHAIDEIGNMTDVHPFDGDTSATDLVYVDHSGDAIKFIESDAQEQYVLAPGKTISNVAWAGASGRVASLSLVP